MGNQKTRARRVLRCKRDADATVAAMASKDMMVVQRLQAERQASELKESQRAYKAQMRWPVHISRDMSCYETLGCPTLIVK